MKPTPERLLSLYDPNDGYQPKSMRSQSGLLLPGWFCLHCQAFNGTVREDLKKCRCCEAPKGTSR